MATTVMTSASQDSFNSKLYLGNPYGGTDSGGFSLNAFTLSAFEEASLAGGDGHSSSAYRMRSDNSRFATHMSAIHASRRTPSASPVSSRRDDSQAPLSENAEFETRDPAESNSQDQQSFSEEAEDDPEGHRASPEHALVRDTNADFLAEDSAPDSLYAEEEQDTAVLRSEVPVGEGEGEGVAPSLAAVDGAGDAALQTLALAAELATFVSHYEPDLPEYSAFVQQLPADSNQTPTEFTQAPIGLTTSGVNFDMPMLNFDSALNDPLNELDLALDNFDPSVDEMNMPSASFTATSQAQHDASKQVQLTNFEFDEQYLVPQAPRSFASRTPDYDSPSGAKRSYTEFDESLVDPTSYLGLPYSAFSDVSAYSVGGGRRKQVQHYSCWAQSGVKAIVKDGATSIQPLNPGDQLFITSMTEDDPYE